MSEETLLSSEIEIRRALESSLDEVDRLWSSYAEKVRRIMDDWERVKVKLLERISMVNSLLKSVNEDLERLSVEVALGLAEEEDKRGEISKLEAMKMKLENRMKALQDFLEAIEARVLEHGERLRTGNR